MRQGRNKHIFLHSATFIQGPSPILDDPWRRVDVVPVLPSLNYWAYTQLRHKPKETRKTDVTEEIQVEIKERREGRRGIYSPIHPAPILESISCPPNNNTTITHMRQGNNKHIFLHEATFIQGPSPLLDDPWWRVDVVLVLPAWNSWAYTQLLHNP